MKPNWNLFWVMLFFLLFSVVYCRAEEIDISAIIQIESSGNPNAISKSGCIGLMGINPKGALADWNTFYCDSYYTYPSSGYINCQIQTEHNIGDLYNPKINVKIGKFYINERIPQMLKTYGIEDTVENRLIAYHDGIGNLRKYLKGERKLGKRMKAYLKKYKRLTE